MAEIPDDEPSAKIQRMANPEGGQDTDMNLSHDLADTELAPADNVAGTIKQETTTPPRAAPPSSSTKTPVTPANILSMLGAKGLKNLQGKKVMIVPSTSGGKKTYVIKTVSDRSSGGGGNAVSPGATAASANKSSDGAQDTENPESPAEGSIRWTQNWTDMLVNLRIDMHEEFERESTHFELWKQLAAKLQSMGCKDVLGKHCMSKWKAVKAYYFRAQQYNRCCPDNKVPVPFCTQLDPFYLEAANTMKISDAIQLFVDQYQSYGQYSDKDGPALQGLLRNGNLNHIPEYKQDAAQNGESHNADGSNDAGSAAPKWDETSTATLVRLRFDLHEKFKTYSKHAKLWKYICQKLNASGYNYTMAACLRKFKSLKCSYFKAVQLSRCNPGQLVTSPFFADFDQYFRDDAMRMKISPSVQNAASGKTTGAGQNYVKILPKSFDASQSSNTEVLESLQQLHTNLESHMKKMEKLEEQRIKLEERRIAEQQQQHSELLAQQKQQHENMLQILQQMTHAQQ